MSRLQSAGRLVRRYLWSVPFFVLVGLVLGGLISVPLIPRPVVATITISGVLVDQEYTDDILDMLRYARTTESIRGVVLRVDSSGGSVSAVEQIYLDLLRLRQEKPVVISVGNVAASGGYYIAVASNSIYAEPTSQIGNIGAWVNLPQPEELDEDVITSGPFKATGASRLKVMAQLEMVRQQFVQAVLTQRGSRLRLSAEELSRAELYAGVEGLEYGLIDEIGTRTAAVEKAASLAGLRNYDVVDLVIPTPFTFLFFSSSDLADLKTQASLVPRYYYLYFEQE